jgi:hypothetical protein
MKTKTAYYLPFSVYRSPFTVFLIALAMAGCKLDNYEGADTVINGLIVDDAYASFQTQTPNGAKVRFYEKYNGVWSTQPYDVWVHQDGTFNNDFAFAGEYKIVAEGAFFPADTQIVRIADTKKVALVVTPYLYIDIETIARAGRISMGAKIRKVENAPKNVKIESMAFMISNTPNVDINSWMRKGGEEQLLEIPDDVIQNETYVFSFSGLDAGRTYYVRVGALAQNDANLWNYSRVAAVKPE